MINADTRYDDLRRQREAKFPVRNLSERNDFPARRETKARCARPDRIGDVGRRQVPVVHFHHAGVAVPEVLRHHHQRHARHRREARPGMA